MTRFTAGMAAMIALFLMTAPVQATTATAPAAAVPAAAAPATPAPTGMQTIAKSAVVVDLGSGTVLLDKNSKTQMPTASMSKTMTIYMVFDALKRGQIRLDTTFPVSEKAWRMQGSKMFVELGSQIAVEDLIKGVVIQSGNDATIVLAEGISGTEERFAADMTAKAKALGMNDSNFMNASGWPDPDHYSTPHDLALLAWHIIKDFPEYYKYFGIKEFTWHGITQQNRDPLLGRVDGADGLKTGHTEEAGYGLIGSAQRNGRRVIMVISGLLSDKDRATEGARLMNWALDSFKRARLFKAGAEVYRAPVAFGLTTDVPLVVATDIGMTIPIRALPKDIQAKVKFNSPIVAPLAKGQQVGTLEITVPEIGTREFPVYTGADIAEKGFVAKTFEKIIHGAGTKK